MDKMKVLLREFEAEESPDARVDIFAEIEAMVRVRARLVTVGKALAALGYIAVDLGLLAALILRFLPDFIMERLPGICTTAAAFARYELSVPKMLAGVALLLSPLLIRLIFALVAGLLRGKQRRYSTDVRGLRLLRDHARSIWINFDEEWNAEAYPMMIYAALMGIFLSLGPVYWLFSALLAPRFGGLWAILATVLVGIGLVVGLSFGLMGLYKCFVRISFGCGSRKGGAALRKIYEYFEAELKRAAAPPDPSPESSPASAPNRDAPTGESAEGDKSAQTEGLARTDEDALKNGDEPTGENAEGDKNAQTKGLARTEEAIDGATESEPDLEPPNDASGSEFAGEAIDGGTEPAPGAVDLEP